MSARTIKLACWGFLVFAAVSLAWAHDPFDLSCRMTVYNDRIELDSIFGTDAMRKLLSRAGRSEEEIVFSLKARGPNADIAQPIALASCFVQLTHDGESLVARRVASLAEGTEVHLTAVYPRPAAGSLDVQAVCYESIPNLRNGLLIVVDESSQLGVTLLSSANTHLLVSLPKIEPGSSVSATAGEPTMEPSATAGAVAMGAANTRREPSLFPRFFKLGVEHILTGYDHLLFLAALLIGLRRWSRMLSVITCFTLAHSVTLAVATLNLIAVSSRIVEPLIAASIVVVCLLNLARKHAEGDRVWLAGAFGLIHGFGFAAVLRETGLGAGGASIAVPLVAFNLGVEAGQLAIAAVLLPLLFRARRWENFARFGIPAISTCVIAISGYWVIERALGQS